MVQDKIHVASVGMPTFYYLHQVGFVFVGVSLFVCEFVRLQAGLHKIYLDRFLRNLVGRWHVGDG